jgi:hypothetical protein
MAVDIVINKREKEIRNTRPENSLKIRGSENT